jgi:PAS domain S-box-containing protein
MATELRKTGISVVGDVPWGTHFCHFYETKQDLLDTLVPYFKAGLESQEFCMWVVSNPEILTTEEAKGALAQAVSDLDRHLSEKNIEILDPNDWYFEKNALNLERARSGWDAKLKRALARGYDGLRVSADTFWLGEKDWKDFFAYEKQVNDWITNQSMTVMCTYPLAKSGANEVLDVVQAHQFAIARRQGEWEVIETPELIQAKAEIKRLNEELEQSVVERTGQLAKAIEELTDEISERKQSEVELRLAHQRLSYHVENTPLAVIEWDKDLFIKRWSKRAEEVFGWTASEALGINMYDRNFPVVHEEDVQAVAEIAGQLINGTIDRNLGLNRNYTKDGNAIHCEWYNSVLRDEDGNVITILSLVHDVTERKRAEAALDERLRFETLVTELSAAFANLWPNEVDREIDKWLRSLAEFLGVDRASFFQFGEDWTTLYRSHSYTVPGIEPLSPPPIGMKEQFPWITDQLRQGITVKWPRIPDDMPQEAAKEKEYAAKLGVKSGLNIPVVLGGSVICAFTFTSIVTYRDWPDAMVARLRLVGEIFAAAVERKRAAEHINATTEQLRALSASLQSAREEEGTRIAREIHDELGGGLTSLKWDLESFDKVIAESPDRPHLPVLREQIQIMLKISETMISAVRRISSELRPSVLDDLGLVEAIEWQLLEFQARTRIICHYECSTENVDLNQEESTAVFRIFQEALTNILRHAQATRVDIVMKEEAGEFVLSVSDNGKGITEDDKSRLQSLGLLGMCERAHLIGAEIDIIGVEAQGTVVTVRVPQN